jgi:hypothetical protein
MTLKIRFPQRAAISLLFVCVVSCHYPVTPDLKPYTQCKLGNEFQIFRVDGPAVDFAWPTPTKNGDVQIKVDMGYRVLINYMQTELFGNLKVERLPKDTYAKEKADILSSLAYLAAEPYNDGQVRSEIKNGVTLYGINRKKLEGGVLSIYNLFQDDAQIVVTMYLLNDYPETRKFGTIDQYAVVRDKFLNAYTACVAQNLRQKTARGN